MTCSGLTKGGLLLLRHLAAAEQGMRVLVLGTYRDSELFRSHPLVETLAALHRQSSVYRIGAGRTGRQRRGGVLEAIAGYTLDDAAVNIAHAVYRETDGNPFFVNEILPPPVRDRGHLPGLHRSMGRQDDRRATGFARERARGDRQLGSGGSGRKPRRCCRWQRSSVETSILIFWKRHPRDSEEELLDILDASAAAGLVREMGETQGHLQLRPRSHPAHPVRGPRPAPGVQERIEWWPKRWRISAGIGPVTGSANSHVTGPVPAGPST